jgi:hypothetical protein
MPRDIPYQPDYETDALESVLLSQFRDKPTIRAFVAAMSEGSQLLEDEIYDLVGQLDLDTATGFGLNLLGGRVFEQRRGLSDDEYRAIIRGKIRALRGGGTAQDIYETALAASAAGVTVELRELPPASYEVTFVSNASVTPSALYRKRLRALMGLTKPAGWQAEYLLAATTPSFAFEGPPDEDRAGFDEGGFIDLL